MGALDGIHNVWMTRRYVDNSPPFDHNGRPALMRRRRLRLNRRMTQQRFTDAGASGAVLDAPAHQPRSVPGREPHEGRGRFGPAPAAAEPHISHGGVAFRPLSVPHSRDVSPPSPQTAGLRAGEPPRAAVDVMAPPKPCNLVVVSAVSGGIGTSVLAAVLAEEFAGYGAGCALVDADFEAGGLDVLLGIENERGLRFSTLDAPLGRIDGDALNHELPRWDRVTVLSFDIWNAGAPEWWQAQAAVRALSESNQVVVVDAGRGAAIDRIGNLSCGVRVLAVELSVLGLARARARLRAAAVDDDLLLVGMCPRGGNRRQGVVGAVEAEDYLGAPVDFLIDEDRHMHDDVLSGLGIRVALRRNRRTVTRLAERVRGLLRERGAWIEPAGRGADDGRR